MVGLSVILEAAEGGCYKHSINNNSSQVVVVNYKASGMMKSAASSSSLCSTSKNNRNSPEAAMFLDSCFLCKQKLLPGNDIYMYKGDTAFCSVECRCRQIFMDEAMAKHTTPSLPPHHQFISLKS